MISKFVVRCPACDTYTQHTELSSYAHRYQCGMCKRTRLICPAELAELRYNARHRPRTAVYRDIRRYLA